MAVICLLLGVSDKFYSVENNKMEFLLLVIFIYIGAVFLLNSIDFISILILLECIAFSSYILVGFERQNKFSSSSGIKYLILGSIPGGLFVLGITLLYKNYGSFFLCNLENLLIATDNNNFINDCLQNINQSSNDVIFYDKILNNDSNFTDSGNNLNVILDSLYYKSIFLSTYVAIILIFINLLFKLTAAPVHM
jgi:NADH:ubiquinone oxidoreductase subunit 2 (subunit N)